MYMYSMENLLPFCLNHFLLNHLQVRNLVWSPDDSRLVSCSMDGAVYEWNVQTGKREKECVLKSCNYTSVALSPDLRTTFAVGSDRTLKEIVLADSQVKYMQLYIQICAKYIVHVHV